MCMHAQSLLSHVQLFVTPWTVAHQAPPSMGFSKQEYWSGVPFPSPMYEMYLLVIYWVNQNIYYNKEKLLKCIADENVSQYN